MAYGNKKEVNRNDTVTASYKTSIFLLLIGKQELQSTLFTTLICVLLDTFFNFNFSAFSSFSHFLDFLSKSLAAN